MLLFLLVSTSSAETLYVTDKLYLGLHELPRSKGKQIKVLASGTKLKVLERIKDYVKVRTPEGTLGWTKSAYLVDEIPPRLQLTQLQDKNEKLAAELSSTRSKIANIDNIIKDLEDRLSRSNEIISEKSEEINTLTSDNEQYRNDMEKYKNSVPISLALGASLVCLVLGFIAGIVLLDYRSRKKHGGFRIY
jgi:SH3 domain protein